MMMMMMMMTGINLSFDHHRRRHVQRKEVDFVMVTAL